MVRTIARLWRDAVGRGPHEPAYLVERGERAGARSPGTRPARAVDELAYGLLALGIRKGDAFGILAPTRLEWALVDFALARVGAVGGPDLREQLARATAPTCSGTRRRSACSSRTRQQRAKIADAPLPTCSPSPPSTSSRARGREHAARIPTRSPRPRRRRRGRPLHLHLHVGTTGPPKACMIRHRNYYAMAASVDRVADFTLADDLMLLYLPLAHNFGRLMHLLGAYEGYTIAFCPDPYAVAEALPAVRPTVLPSVPRIYEKVTRRVSRSSTEHGPRRRLVDWALASAAGRARYARGASAAARARAPAPPRRPARLLEGEGAPRRPSPDRHLRRRPAGARDRRVLPRARHPDPRGLRASPSARPRPPSTGRTRFRFGTVGPRAARIGAARRPTTASS